jgi:hypothetical protein
MSLPWVRLDANIAQHDKVLRLIAQPGGWRAYAVYTFALGYSGGHATDGLIARHVLGAVHGTQRIADLLVEAGMWEVAEDGWLIHNYAERQELALVGEMKRRNRRLAGLKSQCVQRHGPDCGCWKAVPDA